MWRSEPQIEQAVISSLYEAMAGKAPLATAHLAEEFKRTRPLSVVMAEKVAALRGAMALLQPTVLITDEVTAATLLRDA